MYNTVVQCLVKKADFKDMCNLKKNSRIKNSNLKHNKQRDFNLLYCCRCM